MGVFGFVYGGGRVWGRREEGDGCLFFKSMEDGVGLSPEVGSDFAHICLNAYFISSYGAFVSTYSIFRFLSRINLRSVC